MASRLQDVILRGTAAARPLATAVAPSTLYYSTDTATTAMSDGTTWVTYADAGGTPAPHSTTHSSGGADPVTVTNLAGFPGGSTNFLRADGTFAAPAAPSRTGVIGVVIDGGGSAITTGVKHDLYVPFACTITASTLIADQTGSIVLDVLKSSAYSTVPTVSIVASAPPTISSAAAAQDATLTGWTVSIAAGSRLRLSVTSVSTVTRLTYSLTVTVP